MQSKEIYDNYIIYENGDIYNKNTSKMLKYSVSNTNQCKISLTVNNKRKTFTLPRLVYENFCGILTKNDIIMYKDKNFINFQYTNLIKVNRKNVLKYNNKLILDINKEWKNIKNYPNYKISNYGDIYSLKADKIMSPRKNLENYLSICLINNTKKGTYQIHRLVYDTFKGFKINTNVTLVIDHIDRDRCNNFIDNLREVSSSENAYNRKNSTRSLRKINQYSLNNIFIKKWDSSNEILKILNLKSRGSILKCCLGKSKTSYGYIWKYDNFIDDIFNYKNIITDDNETYSKYKIDKFGKIINNDNILMLQTLNNGYYKISLVSDNKKRSTLAVHRLVALTFIENNNNHPIVNHIDKNKTNNNANNLEWCTNIENITHSIGIKINQIDKKTNEIIRTFSSITEAGNFINKLTNRPNCRKCIGSVANGKRKTSGGYKWAYINNLEIS